MTWVSNAVITLFLTAIVLFFRYIYRRRITVAIVKYGLIVSCGLVGILWLSSCIFILLMQGDLLYARPWTIIQFCSDYRLLDSITHIKLLAALLVFPSLAGLVFYGYYSDLFSHSIYGNAHWARAGEIKKFALVDADIKKHAGNFIVGKRGSKIISVPLINSILIFAPSRSGKGVGNVIPNALMFPGSLLVTDLKFEIFDTTSGYRKEMGDDVYLFAPTRRDGKTHCWNPLDYVRKNDMSGRIADLQLIIDTLIPFESKSDKMWTQEARSIALGLLLWILGTDRPHTLGELTTLCKSNENLSFFLRNIITESIVGKNLLAIDPTAYMNINNFLNKAAKEQSGVKSTLTSKLILWDDPMINAATHRSDFDFRDIRRKKMSIYLGVQTNQIDRLAPLLNLFIQQFLNEMTDELPKSDEPIKVLGILDEFCNLGTMPVLKRSFSYLAGYHIYLAPIIQNTGQFFDLYGGRDASDVFFQNTDYKIAFRQNTKTDRTFVSEQLGEKTIKVKTKTRQSSGQVSYNESYQAKPLLTPREVGLFPQKKAILLSSGYEPLQYQKIIYYEDHHFKEKVKSPVDIQPIRPLPLSFRVDLPQLEEEDKKKIQPENNKMKLESNDPKTDNTITKTDKGERKVTVTPGSNSNALDPKTLNRLAALFNGEGETS